MLPPTSAPADVGTEGASAQLVMFSLLSSTWARFDRGLRLTVVSTLSPPLRWRIWVTLFERRSAPCELNCGTRFCSFFVHITRASAVGWSCGGGVVARCERIGARGGKRVCRVRPRSGGRAEGEELREARESEREEESASAVCQRHAHSSSACPRRGASTPDVGDALGPEVPSKRCQTNPGKKLYLARRSCMSRMQYP